MSSLAEAREFQISRAPAVPRHVIENHALTLSYLHHRLRRPSTVTQIHPLQCHLHQLERAIASQ